MELSIFYTVVTLAALIGAASNRLLRGNGIVAGKLANEVLFGAFCLVVFAIFHPSPLVEYAYGVPYLLLATCAMWGGSAPGWGRYIGAMAGYEDEPLEEFGPADDLIAWIRPTVRFKKVNPTLSGAEYLYLPGNSEAPAGYGFNGYTSRLRLQLWGFLGLGLRGIFWGALLALTLAPLYPSLYPALAMIGVGFLMAPVYGLVFLASWAINGGRDRTWEGDGWERAEVAWGAVLWGAWAALAMSAAG